MLSGTEGKIGAELPESALCILQASAICQAGHARSQALARECLVAMHMTTASVWL